MTRIALYPGSFDPPTNGHVSLIERAEQLAEKLVVAVVSNKNKNSMFTLDERVAMLEELFGHKDNIEVTSFDGLLVDFAQQQGATILVRGIRTVADFEYEYQMANMNRNLAPTVDTVFLMADPDTFYISSRLVKEVAKLQGDVTNVIPSSVHQRLIEKLQIAE